MSSLPMSRPSGLGTPLPAWRVAGPVLVLLLLALLAVHRETALGMARIWWRSETFMHAMLVPPIALWLVWRRRVDLAALSPSPSPAWLAGIALAALAWGAGQLADTNAVTQLALVAMVVMAVPAVLGHRVARCIAFPLGFLFFAVPIGEFTMPRLMEWTADFTVLALRWSGVPVWREGQMFVIPSGAWSVVEACSGVRYLIASLMVGTLFAYLNYRRAARRWAFVAVAIAVPVVANWVRAYLIVMLGHLSGNRLAVGVDHLVYGWVFFGVVMAIMFGIGARWQEREPARRAGPEPAPEATAATRGGPQPSAGATAFLAVAVAALLLAAAPPAAVHALDHAFDGPAARGAQRPLAWSTGPLGARWTPAPPAADWQPAFVAPSARFAGAWTAEGAIVDLDIAWYRDQGDGHRLVSSLNALVTSNDRDWRQLDAGQHEIDLGGTRLKVHAARLARAAALGRHGTSLRVWQLYWIDDRFTANEVEAKLLAARQRLLRGRDDGAALFIATPDADDPAVADAVLAAFLRDNLAAIASRLRVSRDGGMPK